MTRLQNLIPVLIYALVAASIFVGDACTQAGNSPKTIRIIYTNDNMGYLEPCGCGGRYQGGLARRVTAFSQLIKENPNTLIIDSGNISSQKENVGIIASIMSALKYDSVGIGASETYYPGEFFKQSDKFGLHVLSTMAPESKNTSPYIIKSIDGVKVGVISYGRDIAASSVRPETRQGFQLAYKTVREKSDILVLLDQGGIAKRDWLESISDGIGAPDIVIAGMSNAIMSKEKIIGATHVMPTSIQGKQIGIIDIEVASDRSMVLTQKMFLIDKEIAEDQIVKKQIDEFLNLGKTLASLSPATLNMGSIKKGGIKEEYVTLTPKVAHPLTISKAYSSGKKVSAPEWKLASDGSYRIKIVADVGNVTGRFLETVSIELDLPDNPTLSLLVFGNIVDE